MDLLRKWSKTESNSIQVEIYEWKITYGSAFVKYFCNNIQFLI